MQWWSNVSSRRTDGIVVDAVSMPNAQSCADLFIDLREEPATKLEDEKGVETGNQNSLKREKMSQHYKPCKTNNKNQVSEERLCMKVKRGDLSDDLNSNKWLNLLRERRNDQFIIRLILFGPLVKLESS